MEIAEHSVVKQNKINSLDGLKMVAMMAVFLWHSILWDSYIDLGARGCELLFVISGFLVGYNYICTDVPATWKESFRYALKKVYKFWPLHFFTTMLLLFLYIKTITVAELYKCLISLCMLQAWSNNQDVFFACNGAMWFMSAIMFCYFLSPFLLKLIKRGIRFSIVVFFIVFFVRFSIDYIKFMYQDGLLLINTHVSPVIRCMEFLMGMLMVPCFMHIKEWAKNLLKTKRMILFSVIELLVLGGMIYLLIFHTELWRSVFVLAFCPVVFVLALNEGLISRFLGIKPFKWFSKIQLEFYILHLAMIRLFFNLDFIGFDSKWIQGLTMLIIVIIAATAYHVLLTDRLAVHMKSLFSRLIDKKSFN